MARTRSVGTYQPRTRRAELADLSEDLRRAFSEFMATIALRSAGAIVFLGCSAFLVAIASYSAEDFELQQCDGPRPA